MVATTNQTSVERLNQANVGKLPEHLGLSVTEVSDGRVAGRFTVRPDLVAHTGYLLAGVGLTLADLLCAYGVSTAWPEGARSFTTAEIKCNFIGTATTGSVEIVASLVHSGRTTQLWDAEITSLSSGRRMALF
ncbi:MAG: PaaI family thioesterase, partial [Phenylobacterium sp.]|nr:PaaI family thioesterase [Phenylobacterium sp.]